MTSMGTVAMTLAARTTSHWPSPPYPNWSRMTLRPRAWIPFPLIALFFAFHLGGWAKSAA